ncbi:hypothetical protein Q7P37_009713 [Cladosporium fusiforme]
MIFPRVSVAATPLTLLYMFTFIYLTTVLYIRSISSRDPGSWFFDPSTAYRASHSDERRRQAELFVGAANTTAFSSYTGHLENGKAPRMCIGIPSVAREPRHIDATIGSLVDGLTTHQRNELYLIVLLPHSDATKHSAYQEPWLRNLVDEIIHYNNSGLQNDHIVALEHEQSPFREKGLFDYKLLLNACLQKTDAPYVAIFEDDIVATFDWYQLTLAGITEAESRFAHDTGRSRGFLYLRLFYTEQFLGWNIEDWPSHGFWSAFVVGGSWLLLHCIRWRYPNSTQVLSLRLVVGVCFVVEPLLILLLFATGRVTLQSFPTGVRVMNEYGCCSQGLVFPRPKAQDLVSWFGKEPVGFVDSQIEKFADQHSDGERLALVPPVIQHVGSKSTKDQNDSSQDSQHRSAAEQIWSFRFETQRAGS